MTNRIKNNILVCGALAYDQIMDFPGRFADHILPDKIHILNLAFTLNNVTESFGGTGGNIAYSLALLGEKPRLVSVAGQDFGPYKKWLLKNKIDISGVNIVKDKKTAKFYVITDKEDNQIGGYYPGPKIPSRLPLLSVRNNTLAIIAPDTVARMVEYAKIFRQNRIKYIFDPGQQTPYYTASQLKYSISGSEMLIGNDYEIQLVLNKLKIKLKALEKMIKILVITKGGQGAEIYYQDKKAVIPAAKKKKFIDPTGAGDAFRAGFIKGLALGWPLIKCARLAMVVSAYAVERQGTQAHKFNWAGVKKRYEENYHENF